ncbi:GNAT family N-acetyltransferase [Actinomadura adrarensis]|uniref:GNAT family N-acetyltransferase n=1 Tax=Actinomadura adrarensis TaxID=1819600 RepID=A0ABW3CRW9_9ACTN
MTNTPDTALARTAAELDEFLSRRSLRESSGPADSLRVTLRPLTPDDQDEYVELVRASKDLLHPWMSLPSTPEEFQAYLERFDHLTSQGLAVALRDGGAMAGTIYINSIIRGRFQCASVAYAAFAPTAGQGYMSEGLSLAVRYAFEQLRLHRLEANIQPGNHASLKLVERQGFRKEGYSPAMLFIDGEWRDHERWALTTNTPDKAHPSLPAR